LSISLKASAMMASRNWISSRESRRNRRLAAYFVTSKEHARALRQAARFFFELNCNRFAGRVLRLLEPWGLCCGWTVTAIRMNTLSGVGYRSKGINGEPPDEALGASGQSFDTAYDEQSRKGTAASSPTRYPSTSTMDKFRGGTNMAGGTRGMHSSHWSGGTDRTPSMRCQRCLHPSQATTLEYGRTLFS